MKFSIVVPVYRVEKYLNECVDSLLSQSFPDFELILVDDGSPDACPDICDGYAEADKRVRVLHQKNAGVASARNAGLAVAGGEYVIFIDSDDYVSSADFLRSLNDECDGQVDIVMFGYKKYFDRQGVFGAEVCNYPQDLASLTIDAAVSKLLQANMYDGASWLKAVRRETLVDNGIVFRTNMISEDSDWFLQVITSARSLSAISRPFIVYRQRSGSITHTASVKSVEDNLWLLETWSERIDKMDVTPSYKTILLSVLSRYWSNLLVLCSMIPLSGIGEENWIRLKKVTYLRRYAETRRARVLACFTWIIGLKATVVMLKVARLFLNK